MRLSFLLPLALVATPAVAQPPAPQSERAKAWWATVSTLAADDMEGREAGSAGHRRASVLVARRFAALGLGPAGENVGPSSRHSIWRSAASPRVLPRQH